MPGVTIKDRIGVARGMTPKDIPKYSLHRISDEVLADVDVESSKMPGKAASRARCA
jgi:hypothetical protein